MLIRNLLRFVSFTGLLVFASCDSMREPNEARNEAARPVDAARFRSRLSAFIDELRANPYAPPGFAVAVLHRCDVIFERAYGTRDAATGTPLTIDTPIYNASTTKAYTGLLAAILHEEGAMSLDTTLKDVWPGMPATKVFDPAQVRAVSLLAHVAPIHEGGVQFRSNTTGQIVVADIPGLLTEYAVARSTDFSYSNFGPYLWSAMMEAKTGVPWRENVRRKVFAPLGLSQTSARLEDLDPAQVAHCHSLIDGKWQPLPFKPTPILNAAGGIYSSARDTSEFLRAFLSEGQSAGARIPAAALRLSWERQSVQDRNFLEMHRDGYGLGWDLGALDGRPFVSRSGGAAGCRSIILFLPEEELGVVVLSAGDVGANQFNSAILSHAIDLWTDAPDIESRAQSRVESHAATSMDVLRTIQEMEARARKAPLPDPALVQAAVGCYENARLGRFALFADDGVLRISGGAFTSTLYVVEGDKLFLWTPGSAETESFRLNRDASDRIVGFLWDDDTYNRC